FAGKKSAQIREILISESAWEEMTCLFAPSLEQGSAPIVKTPFLYQTFSFPTSHNKIYNSTINRGVK
ncbi:curli production assembly/transport protein CsgE, partial [Klebsiella quasivariicola]